MTKRVLFAGLVLSMVAIIGFFIRERILLQDEVVDGVRVRSHLLREKVVSARVIVSAMKETNPNRPKQATNMVKIEKQIRIVPVRCSVR